MDIGALLVGGNCSSPLCQEFVSSTRSPSHSPQLHLQLLTPPSNHTYKPLFPRTFIHSQHISPLNSQLSSQASYTMRTIMSRSPHESSFSFSRRYFNFPKKQDFEEDDEQVLTTQDDQFVTPTSKPIKKKKLPKLISALSLLAKPKRRTHTLGTKVTGTLFGHRRGHVVIAFQDEPRSRPAFLIQISTPTGVLVREMASGLVRVALECDRKSDKKGGKLLEETLWRAYCNGKKCGYATRRDAGEEDMKVLEAVGRVSMGAGVFPGGGGAAEGELMYMRAKFERVVGSKDSESFYMVNPDGNGGPELSVYLLRV